MTHRFDTTCMPRHRLFLYRLEAILEQACLLLSTLPMHVQRSRDLCPFSLVAADLFPGLRVMSSRQISVADNLK